MFSLFFAHNRPFLAFDTGIFCFVWCIYVQDVTGQNGVTFAAPLRRGSPGEDLRFSHFLKENDIWARKKHFHGDKRWFSCSVDKYLHFDTKYINSANEMYGVSCWQEWLEVAISRREKSMKMGSDRQYLDGNVFFMSKLVCKHVFIFLRWRNQKLPILWPENIYQVKTTCKSNNKKKLNSYLKIKKAFFDGTNVVTLRVKAKEWKFWSRIKDLWE